jgi:hypothetical protein
MLIVSTRRNTLKKNKAEEENDNREGRHFLRACGQKRALTFELKLEVSHVKL